MSTREVVGTSEVGSSQGDYKVVMISRCSSTPPCNFTPQLQPAKSALHLHPATSPCKFHPATWPCKFYPVTPSCNFVLQLRLPIPDRTQNPHRDRVNLRHPWSTERQADWLRRPQPLTTAHSLGARPALCCVQTFTPEFARAVWIHQILSSRGQ